MEGYCVKCKALKEMVNPVEVNVPPRGKMTRGTCPVCGTVIFFAVRPPTPPI